MTQVRRPIRNSPRRDNNIHLFIGMVIGAVLMFWFVGLTGIASNYDSSSSTSRSLRAPSDSSAPSSEAWHPIHVFYGDRNALPHSDQEWFAQVHQDQVILELLGDNGYFIDLAANDASELTNTLALERHGWNGLCVEPNPGYWYGLSHRKCTVVGALVGGTIEKVKVKFRGVYGGIVGKLDDKLANRKREPEAAEGWRYTAPLANVLTRFNVPKTIDYLSLDVEGAEMLIMKEFPFDEYTIKVMTVERPGKDLKKLLESKGYVFLKDLAWWGETLWAHTSTGLTPDHPKIQKIKTEERN